MYLRISILSEKYDMEIVPFILKKDNPLIECVDFEHNKASMCSEFPDRIGAFLRLWTQREFYGTLRYDIIFLNLQEQYNIFASIII